MTVARARRCGRAVLALGVVAASERPGGRRLRDGCNAASLAGGAAASRPVRRCLEVVRALAPHAQTFREDKKNMIVDIIAWIVLGAIAGYIAGFLVKGDEGLGVIGHIVLGIVGAIVGGFLANVIGLNSGRQDGDIVNLASIVVAVVGAIITIVVVSFITRSTRRGSGVV